MLSFSAQSRRALTCLNTPSSVRICPSRGPANTPLFEGLSFTVGDGHTGLVAPNGAGKSTLLKLIAGDYRPSAGSVTVDGCVGYLPQTLPFDADRTVAEVLGVAAVLEALDGAGRRRCR